MKDSALKALIASLLYVLVYYFNNIEYIREEIEDYAFDFLDSFFLKDETVLLKQSPQVLIFKIDDKYLESNGLKNKDSKYPKYGYIFPRDYIAKFIEKIDKLPQDKKPQALFIDYDFSYFSTPKSETMSKEDKKLLEVLLKPRDYKIVIPKVNDYNYLEKYLSEYNITNNSIFASVEFLVSSDEKTRRFKPISEYRNAFSYKKQSYVHAAILLYNMSNIGKRYKFNIDSSVKSNIIFNRIIFKDRYQSSFPGIEQSYWKNLTIYSATYDIKKIPSKKIKNSIILLGGTNSSNEDNFQIAENEYESQKGIYLLGDALMTIFYNKGKFKQVNLYLGFVIIFFIVLIFDFLSKSLAQYFGKKSTIAENILSFLFIGFAMILISYMFLHEENPKWFNWIIPLLVYEIIDFVEFDFLTNKKRIT